MNSSTSVPSIATDGKPRLYIYVALFDPEEERTCLLQQIIPDLRRDALEQHMGELELEIRWGAAGASPTAYYSEIVRHHPSFFIGILGRSSGQLPVIPGYAPGAIAKDFPWLSDAARRTHDLAETGVIERVLNDPLMYDRAFFFIREGSTEGPLIEPADKRAAQLEEQIRKRKTARVYRDLDSFRTQVQRDLMAILVQKDSTMGLRPALAREQRVHQACAAKHLPAYVERSRDLLKLDTHIAGTGPPKLVIGPAGVGKSALLAYWSERYRHQDQNAFVITHFVGAGPSAQDHGTLLRRIMMEIGERYTLDKEIPTNKAELAQALPEWLAYVQGERLVLVIDAVDELDEGSQDLRWLPDAFQPNIRVILSARGITSARKKREGKWSTLTVAPLNMEERRQVIEKLLAPLGISLPEEQSRAISGGALSSSPLSLRLVLAQLGIYGGREDEVIASYLAANDLATFYEQLLDRLEQGPGGEYLGDVLSLIWGSRSGLSAAELQGIICMKAGKPNDIIPGKLKELAPLLISLNPYLVRYDGRLTFVHDSLRQAVQTRWTLRDGTARRVHIRLARYFAKGSTPKQRAEEEPWQWQQAQKWTELRKCITTRETFLELVREEKEYEFWQYWLSVGGPETIGQSYDNIITAIQSHNGTYEETQRLLDRFGMFLYRSGCYSLAECALRRALGNVLELEARWTEQTYRTLAHLTETLMELGSYKDAAYLCRRALDAGKRSRAVPSPLRSELLNNLALALHYQGDLEEAEKAYYQALRFEEELFGTNHPNVADRLHNLGTVLNGRRNYIGAETTLLRTIEIRETVLGDSHPLTLLSKATLANTYYAMERYTEAENLHRGTLAKRERMLGKFHPHTGQSALNLGAVLRSQGKFDEASPLYLQALKAFEQAHGACHQHVATCLNNLGMLSRQQDDLDAAERWLRRAVDTYIAAVGPGHYHSITASFNLALVYEERGETAKAITLLEHLLPIAEEALGAGHPRVEMIRDMFDRLRKE